MAGNQGSNLLERIAVTLRSGHYNYLSLESALLAYGIISQVPLAGITVMTTGRSGIFDTPFGRIEFIHTKRHGGQILDHTRDVGWPLRMTAGRPVSWRWRSPRSSVGRCFGHHHSRCATVRTGSCECPGRSGG